MGYYINPENESKEAFLARHGQSITPEDFLELEFCGLYQLVVALVDNGWFSAAIICFSKEELEHVQRMTLTDKRPLKFYIVKKEHLEEFLE